MRPGNSEGAHKFNIIVFFKNRDASFVIQYEIEVNNFPSVFKLFEIYHVHKFRRIKIFKYVFFYFKISEVSQRNYSLLIQRFKYSIEFFTVFYYNKLTYI